MQKWYYKHDGQTQGPVDSIQLQDLAQSGRLHSSDEVRLEGTREWIPVSKMEKLKIQSASINPTPNSPKPSKEAPSTIDLTNQPPLESKKKPSKRSRKFLASIPFIVFGVFYVGYSVFQRLDNYAEDKYKAGCYFFNSTNPNDKTKAVECFKLAASKGHSGAMCQLGICYAKGIGVTQNFTEAVKWFRQAAEKDDPVAMFNLGVCYSEGIGVYQSEQEAVNWFQKAARLGHEDSQKVLREAGYSW